MEGVASEVDQEVAAVSEADQEVAEALEAAIEDQVSEEVIEGASEVDSEATTEEASGEQTEASVVHLVEEEPLFKAGQNRPTIRINSSESCRMVFPFMFLTRMCHLSKKPSRN